MLIWVGVRVAVAVLLGEMHARKTSWNAQMPLLGAQLLRFPSESGSSEAQSRPIATFRNLACSRTSTCTVPRALRAY